MYALLSGLWRYVFAKPQYQILLLGLDNAGKTTMLEQCKHTFTKGAKAPAQMNLVPTIGLNIGRFDVGKSRLIAWDLGGQESLRVLWDRYLTESHGLVFLVDSTDHERLEQARAELERLLGDPALRDCPFYILCNKQDDLDHAWPLHKLVDALGIRLEDDRRIHVRAISALRGIGVREAIETFVDLLAVSPRTQRIGCDQELYDIVSCGADRRIRLWCLSEEGDGLHFTQTVHTQSSSHSAAGGSAAAELPRLTGITTLAFSPSGSTLVAGAADGSVNSFSTAPDWQFTGMLTRLQGRVHQVAFSGGGGNFLACAGESAEIKIVNTISQGLAALIQGPESGAKGLAFDPLKKYLAVAGCDGLLRVWDVQSAKTPSVVYVAPSFPRMPLDSLTERGRLCWSPNGEYLAIPGHRAPVLLQRDTWTQVSISVQQDKQDNKQDKQAGSALSGHDRPISVCAWSPSNRFLATAAPDNSVLVWEVPAKPSGGSIAATIVGMKTIRSNDACVTAIAWSPEQNLLAYLTSEGDIELWRLPIPHALFQSHPFPRRSVAVAEESKESSTSAAAKANKTDPMDDDDDGEEGVGLAELARRKKEAQRNKYRDDSWDSEDEARMAKEAELALRGIDEYRPDDDTPSSAVSSAAVTRVPRARDAGVVSTELSDDEEGAAPGDHDNPLELDADGDEVEGDDDHDFVARKRGRVRSVGVAHAGESRAQARAQAAAALGAASVVLQEPFNSGATKNKKRRFLAWNHIGCVVSRTEVGFESIEIEFTDTSLHRNVRQRFPHPFQLGALGPHGALFASHPSLMDAADEDDYRMDSSTQASVRPGVLFYYPFDSWAKNSEWTVQLPDSEVALSTAVGSDWAAVGTSRQVVRVFSHSGRQLLVWSLPGPVLTLAGHRNLLAVVHYANYPGPHYTPPLQLVILNTSTKQRVHQGAMPLSPPSGIGLGPGATPGLGGKPAKLYWLAFADNGMLLSLDSAGVMRGLAALWDWTWVMLADFKEQRAAAGKAQTARSYWPVSFVEDKLMAVPLVGSQKQPGTHPRPILEALDLRIPLLRPNRTSAKELAGEEKYLRQSLLLGQNPDEPEESELSQLDALLLGLFLEACKQENPRLVRALDLSTSLGTRKGFVNALQIVKHKNQPLLMERLKVIMKVKFAQLPAGGAIKRRAPGSGGDGGDGGDAEDSGSDDNEDDNEAAAQEEESKMPDEAELAKAREMRRKLAEEKRREWERRRSQGAQQHPPQSQQQPQQQQPQAQRTLLGTKVTPPPAKKVKASKPPPEEPEDTPGVNPFAA